MHPVILAYHAIGTTDPENDPANLFISPEAFEAQIAFLADHRAVVPLDEAMDGSMSNVAITFDDGYRSVLELAAPIMARHGVPGAVFVPTLWIGRPNGWDDSDVPGLDVMTAEELVQLRDYGIDIESHGHAHIDMSRHTEDEVREDIERSLSILQTITGRRPRYLAYPYGLYSPAARAAVASLGLKGAFSIDAGGSGRLMRVREHITGVDGPLVFRMKARGWYGPLRRSPAGNIAYSAVRPVARRLLLRKP